jgi:putative FmdB family regulatory protein
MPVYVFRCTACGADHEALLPLGETGQRTCPQCGQPARQRFGRVAVRYGAWGFTATDSLVGDPRGKDFRSLREKAEQISDE